MSLHLEFDPHSWYMGFAIKHTPVAEDGTPFDKRAVQTWVGYAENGNFYVVDELRAHTLKELKEKIREYRRQEKERIERLYANTAS